MKEWRCKVCGNWVSGALMRHYHTRPREMTLEEMRGARERGETPILEEVVTDTWTPQHETREEPSVH